MLAGNSGGRQKSLVGAMTLAAALPDEYRNVRGMTKVDHR
jgi:hypothetical protein